MTLTTQIEKLIGAFTCLAILMSAVFSAGPASAMEIKEVESKGGIKALLVEDYTLPLVAISISFKGGASQDPPGKEGTVRVMSALLDEGAGELDSQAFQEKLESLGIELGFSASRDSVRASLRTLQSNLMPAFDILKLALLEPRFDADAMQRIQASIKTGIARSRSNPSAVAGKALRRTLFANHPYGRNVNGTEESIDSVKRSDLVAMHKNLIVKKGLRIGVVGTINSEQLGVYLDEVFGGLPANSQRVKISEVAPKIGEQVSVNLPSPNASISLVYPGIKRDDPDYFAAYILNHILGGSGFTSRLYNEVREKRGLAYGVRSNIVTLDRTSYLVTGTSTRADNADKALKVIRQEVSRLSIEGITQEELDAAKKYVAGSYAIRNLDTSSKIASVLVALQSDALGLDYLQKREIEINNVTLEKVNQMARDLLGVEPTIVVVGPESG